MKRTTLFTILLIGVFAAVCFLPTGCKVFDRNPSGPDAVASVGTGQTPGVVGTARSVSFRVVLPEASPVPYVPFDDPGANVIAGIHAQAATSAPSVTFKLILVHVGDTAKPTTTLIEPCKSGGFGQGFSWHRGWNQAGLTDVGLAILFDRDHIKEPAETEWYGTQGSRFFSSAG